MKLGDMIDWIEAWKKIFGNPQKVNVTFDFCRVNPDGIDSWRGDYSQLAIGWSDDSECVTVDEFQRMLINSVGKTFHGYKGGEYKADRDTEVFIDNYGRFTNTRVKELRADEFEFVIVSEKYSPN